MNKLKDEERGRVMDALAGVLAAWDIDGQGEPAIAVLIEVIESVIGAHVATADNEHGERYERLRVDFNLAAAQRAKAETDLTMEKNETSILREARGEALADAEYWRTLAEKAHVELKRLNSWEGLMSLLDQHWPEDVFPTEEADDATRDDGARIVSLLRWVANLQTRLELANHEIRYWRTRAETAEAERNLALKGQQ